MMEDTEYHETHCWECKKKVLVELVVAGESHVIGLSVICEDCLKKISDLKKEFPPGSWIGITEHGHSGNDVAAEVERWVKAD